MKRYIEKIIERKFYINIKDILHVDYPNTILKSNFTKENLDFRNISGCVRLKAYQVLTNFKGRVSFN